MSKPRCVTIDGTCPHCGADFTDDSINGTYLFWLAHSHGTGYLEHDKETGEVFYNGQSSSMNGDVVDGYECGACGKKLRLRAGTEEEWS